MTLSLIVNLLSANPTKWSNTLKQFVSKLPTNCLSVFDHFLGLVLKGLTCSKLRALSHLDLNVPITKNQPANVGEYWSIVFSSSFVNSYKQKQSFKDTLQNRCF